MTEYKNEWERDFDKLIKMLGHNDVLTKLVEYLANRKDFANAVKESGKWWK